MFYLGIVSGMAFILAALVILVFICSVGEPSFPHKEPKRKKGKNGEVTILEPTPSDIVAMENVIAENDKKGLDTKLSEL